MKSSGNSSATATPPPSGPSRSAFALTGRSLRLDPLTHAVRGDLADVRLAAQVFAPHYAAPMVCTATREVAVFPTKELAGEPVTRLVAGDGFEAFELAGDTAWGIATGPGLVGYCDRTALEAAA